jgi:hypothetical protein
MNAKVVISVENKYMKDVNVSAQMAAVSVAHVQQERVNEFTICSDVTAIDSPGVITRTFVLALTADFLTQYPDSGSRYARLSRAFKGTFDVGLPADCNESLTLNDGVCP